MSKPFDPYKKWFGIPPEQHPLNHYQLLGIKLYESNLKVIRAAGEKRVEFLQDVSGGEHMDAAQSCLNEVAKAVLCLTNPKKKLAYDHELKIASREKQTAAATTTPIPVSAPSKTTSKPSGPSEFAIGVEKTDDKNQTARQTAPKKPARKVSTPKDSPAIPKPKASGWKKNAKLIKTLVTSLLVITIGVLIVLLVTRSGSTKKDKDLQATAKGAEKPSPDRHRTPGPGVSVTLPKVVTLGPTQFKRLAGLKGQKVIVEGVVASFGESSSKKTKYLNFAKKHEKGITVFMLLRDVGDDWDLPQLRKEFEGKKLQVTGNVRKLPGRNRFGIKVTSKTQIKIL